MKRPLVIAAGGTGGHVFPALAVAERLSGADAPVLFLTDARGARYLEGRLSFTRIRARPLVGGPVRRAMALAALLRGSIEVLWTLGRARPRAAGLFGGYACLPALAALLVLRIPFLLHEQNAVLGRANRLAARFARMLLLSFRDTEGVPSSLSAELRVTGNPVRREVLEGGPAPQRDCGFGLLVIGGSQGAQALAERVPEALARLAPERRRRIRLTLQCRAESRDAVEGRLRELGVAAEVAAFFPDLPARLRRADLVVARAGASTVAELLCTGTPAVLIPYPHALDGHQRANALRLERAGAAVVLDEAEADGGRLAAVLEELMDSPARLAQMRAAARALNPADAADAVARALLELAGEER